jgi:hypothetical protein
LTVTLSGDDRAVLRALADSHPISRGVNRFTLLLRSDVMARYGKKAQSKVAKVMGERKRGTLRSSSGDKVTSRKQAIAIGLSEARRAGGKVPKKKAKGAKSKASKRSAR